MNWYILIIVILLISLYILIKLKKTAGLPLLTCKISTNNGVDYVINIQKINNDVKPVEYIRLLLCFITKMYLISRLKSEDNRTDIRFFLKTIAEAEDFISALEYFKNQIRIVEKIPNSKEKKQIIATLFYKNMQERQISTQIPSSWYEGQFYLSIIILILDIIKNTDDFQKKLLQKSLKNLSKYYYSNANTTSLNSHFHLSNKAYIEATLY